MLRTAAFTIALCLLPAIASAQHHEHAGAAKKEAHAHGAGASEHASFTHVLMQKTAELGLTDEQIAKLEDVSAKMALHHKAMHEQGARTDAAAETKLHEELMAIFTEAQLEKIRPLMKEHMAAMCRSGENQQCKMEAKKKAPIQ